MVGDLDTHDAACRLLCKHAGAHVLAVDYRLAPEHPFPAAVEDGQAAFRWATERAARLGADPARVGVAGDSAGGTISAITSWLATKEGGPAPVLQILLYPATESAKSSRSRELFSDGYLLTGELLDWFTEQYVYGADTTDPRLSISRAGSLEGVAPTLLVTAGFDPLRDEGEAYAESLREAGVTVSARRFPGLVHGFCNTIGTSKSSRDALIEVAGATRALLDTLPLQ